MTVLRIIGQRKWLIVGCVVLSTVITFVVTLVWHTVAPRYTAVARLGVGPPPRQAPGPVGGAQGPGGRPQESPFATSQPEPAEGGLAGLKATHAEMIGRESILLRALEMPEVKRTGWYQRDREGALERLGDVLTVTPAPEANLVSISITDAAPREQDQIDLAEIANAVAIAYVDYVRAAASRACAYQIRLLRDKQAELQEMSDTIRVEIRRKKLPEIEFIHQQMKAQGARLQALTAKGTELELAKIQIEANLKGLEEHTKAGTLSKMPEVRAMVDKQSNIGALRERELSLHSKRVSLLEEVGPKDSSVLAIDASLAAVREQLAQAIKEAAPVQAEALREQLRVKLESVTGQLLSVKELVARIQDTVQVDLQRKLLEMRDLRAREKSIAENIRTINNSLLQLELLIQTDRPVWLRAHATRPKTITSPELTETVPLGALIGLAVGLAVALALGLKPEADSPVDSFTG